MSDWFKLRTVDDLIDDIEGEQEAERFYEIKSLVSELSAKLNEDREMRAACWLLRRERYEHYGTTGGDEL